MTPSMEILVHVSGPCRGTDDARYRREALGFLEYDVAERHTLLGWESHTPNAVEETYSHVKTTDAVVQEAETLSPAQKATYKSRVRDWPGQLAPLRTPAFSRPTASTLPWTTTNQTPHLLIERTPALPRPRTAPTPSTPSQAPPPRRSQSDSWHTPPSIVPDSQPTPPSSGQPALSSSPYLKRPFASSSPSPTRRASPPPAKRPRLQVPSSPPSEDRTIEARPPLAAPLSSPPSAKRRRRRLEVPSSPLPGKSADEARPALAATFSSSPPSAENLPAPSPPPPNDPPQTLEIHPPRPKSTNRAFRTHLTFSLTNIATKLPLEIYFKPIATTRAPGTLERGHWLVPTGSWDEALKRRFWVYLTKFVGRGQGGWGTWCVREVEGPVQAEDKSDKENQAPRRGEVVKVYCWGEVVGEMWLSLFIGSERKISGVGARWVDAGGVAVVVMG